MNPSWGNASSPEGSHHAQQTLYCCYLARHQSVDQQGGQVDISHHCPPQVSLERVLAGNETARKKDKCAIRTKAPDKLEREFVREREGTESVPPAGNHLDQGAMEEPTCWT